MSFNSPGPSGEKAGPLRYTPNYVYNVADCLGKGATASVYLGRERKIGQQVAIKVFSEHESHQITQARLRETEVLKTTNHKNVMRLVASEREAESGQQVIVMPYCQGGSVYALLDQAQNGFGFQEKEFLRFLKDTTSGLKYLREKGITHRDIKPGNIMKGIEEDGSSVYILTDFGAAKKLEEEDEQFMSIYGTEEYIHPAMFQRAVLRQPGQNQFTSSVDLWSLAVTIYHVATGKLPFQAFGGRNDSHMMFQIMSGRKSGEISGKQREPGGPVERSEHLPETCYLSKGLKIQIEPILAGLFETDVTRALAFDAYFDAVNDVINMKTLNVFFVRNATVLILYLRKTDSYVHIQEKVACLTDIPASRQLLLMAHTELRDIVEIHEQIQTYPKAVQNTQIFLFEKENYDTLQFPLSHLPPFPSFSVNSSLSNESSVAKQCAAIGCYFEWKTKEVVQCQNLLLEAKLHLRLYVQEVLCPTGKVMFELDREQSLIKKRSDCIQVSQQNIDSYMKLIEVLKSGSDTFRQLQTAAGSFFSADGCIGEIMSKTYTRCEEIKVYTSVLSQRLRECSTPSPTDHLGCHEADYCVSKVEHIRQGIQTVSSTFSKHKKYGDLHPHEVFIHKVERQKLEDLCVTIISLFQSHCAQNFKTVHSAVNKQLSILLKHLTRARKVEANIKCVVECQTQINVQFNKIDDHYHTVSNLLKTCVKDILENPSVISKIARRETRDFTKDRTAETCGHEEKSTLIKRLLSEVTHLEAERSELDSLMSSNTKSLFELKGMLQDMGRLSPTSFQHDKRSVECTEQSV